MSSPSLPPYSPVFVVRANRSVKSRFQQEKHDKKMKKMENDSKYITDINGFKEHILALIVGYMAVVKLQVKMAKAPPGVDLVLGGLDYSKKGAGKYRKWGLDSPVSVTKKHISELHKGYISVLRDLTKFYSVAKKRQGGKMPSPEAFTGMYGPAVVGPNIVHFFRDSAADFGPVINIDDQGHFFAQQNMRLVDALPGLVPPPQADPSADFGFAIRTTVANMFFLYFRRKKLDAREGRQFKLDDPIIQAFDDVASPPLFGYGNAERVVKKGKEKFVVSKFRINENNYPVDETGNAVTTIAYLENLSPKVIPKGKDEDGEYKQVQVSFQRDNMNVFYLSSLISLNSVTIGDMEKFEPGLEKDALRRKEQLLNEYYLVQYASDFAAQETKKEKANLPKPKRVQSPGKGIIRMPKV